MSYVIGFIIGVALVILGFGIGVKQGYDKGYDSGFMWGKQEGTKLSFMLEEMRGRKIAMAKLDRRLKIIPGREYVPMDSVRVLGEKNDRIRVCDPRRPEEGEWTIKRETFKEMYDLKRS